MLAFWRARLQHGIVKLQDIIIPLPMHQHHFYLIDSATDAHYLIMNIIIIIIIICLLWCWFHAEQHLWEQHLGAVNQPRTKVGLSTQDLGSASKTTLPPHDLDPDPSWVLCCVTVHVIQSSSAMCVFCVPCGAHAQPHWIRIGDFQCPCGEPQYLAQEGNVLAVIGSDKEVHTVLPMWLMALTRTVNIIGRSGTPYARHFHTACFYC